MNRKNIKLYFCPKCKSKNVEYVFGLKNLFGIIPKMKCKNCDYELVGGFPIMVIDRNKLNKIKK